MFCARDTIGILDLTKMKSGEDALKNISVTNKLQGCAAKRLNSKPRNTIQTETVNKNNWPFTSNIVNMSNTPLLVINHRCRIR